MRKKNLTKMVKTLSVALAVTMGLGLTSVPVQAAPKSGLVKSGKKTVYSKKKGPTVFVGGQKLDLDLLVKGKNMKKKVSWKTKDSSVLKITKDGKVTAKKNGSALVEAKYKNKKYFALITVRTRANEVMITEGDSTNALSEIRLSEGETKTFKIRYGLSDKIKKAGGVESTYNSYVTEGSGEVVTANTMNGEEDMLTLTALKAGETNVEVWANQTSEAKVKDKYGVKVNVKVVVEADFNGKQTGAKKITVKGSNLNSDTNAYSVMVNGGKRDITAVTLSEDGREATLNMTGELTEGEYSVEFAGKKANFRGEKAKASKVDIANKNLVLKGDYPSTEGSVEYKVLNQFGEEVTKTVTGLRVESTVGSATVKPNEGKVVLTGLSAVHTIGSPVVLTFINPDPATFFNTSFTVMVSEKAKATSVEVKGIYDSVKKVPYKFAVNSAAENAKARLLLSVKNQYGGRMSSTEGINIVFNPTVTGLGMNTTTTYTEMITVDGVDYLSIPFTGTDAVKEGRANLMLIPLFGGNNGIVKYDIDVIGTKQVSEFGVVAPTQVYAKEKTYFEFTAKNALGEAVKDYATLTNSAFGVKLPESFYFENTADGSAKLVYDATKDPIVAPITWGVGISEIPTYALFTVSATMKPVQLTFKVQAPAMPTAVKKFEVNGVLLGKDTENVLKKLVVGDNKGRELKGKELSLFGDYYVGVRAKNGDFSHFSIVKTGGMTGSTNNKVTLFKISDLASSSLSFKAPSAALMPYVEENVVFELHKDKTGSSAVVGSEVNVKLTATDVKNLSSYEIKLPSVLYSGRTTNPAHVEETETGNVGYNKVKLQVIGKAINGEKVVVGEEHYTISDSENIADTATKILKPSKLAYKATKEGKIMDNLTVIVNDGKGSPTTKAVEVSSELPTVTEITALSEEITVTAFNSNIKAAILDTLELKDRYTSEEFGVLPSTALLKEGLKGINVTSKTGAITVDWNNTAKITASGAVAGDLITVEISFVNGISKTLSYKIK